MKRTPQERETLKASFQKMSLADKADYIWTYYKLPITLGLAALLLLCSTVYRQVTKKEAVLYSALINVTVGEDLDVQLNEGFVASIGASPQKSEVSLYRGMYLSNDPSPENHQYGYALVSPMAVTGTRSRISPVAERKASPTDTLVPPE